MLTLVNPIAILGTTFFMMAVATLWYSEYLFQAPWRRSIGLTDADIARAESAMKQNFIVTFVSYVVAVSLIALGVGAARMFDVPVQYVALGLTAFFAALFASLVVWEQRPWTYYFVTVGFVAIFIIGSTFLLHYWPW